MDNLDALIKEHETAKREQAISQSAAEKSFELLKVAVKSLPKSLKERMGFDGKLSSLNKAAIAKAKKELNAEIAELQEKRDTKMKRLSKVLDRLED